MGSRSQGSSGAARHLPPSIWGVMGLPSADADHHAWWRLRAGGCAQIDAPRNVNGSFCAPLMVSSGGVRQDTDGPRDGKLLVGQHGFPIDEMGWRRVDGSF